MELAWLFIVFESKKRLLSGLQAKFVEIHSVVEEAGMIVQWAANEDFARVSIKTVRH